MRTLRHAVIAVALVTAASGCAAVAPMAPGERLDVVTDVHYYPACGNELLELDGTMYYPLTAEQSDEFLTPTLWQGSAPRGYSRGTGLVAAPGPGDDTGTIVIYDGGYAFFRSDSGDLEKWLTTEKREYDWVC